MFQRLLAILCDELLKFWFLTWLSHYSLVKAWFWIRKHWNFSKNSKYIFSVQKLQNLNIRFSEKSFKKSKPAETHLVTSFQNQIKNFIPALGDL